MVNALYGAKAMSYNSSMNIVYTSDNCPGCHTVKNYLNMKGVEFEERHRDNGNHADEMIKVAGVFTTPVSVINGKVIIGAHIGKIADALA